MSDSESHREVEESNEDKSVFVVDSEEYTKTKKLQLINKTKEEVIDLKHQREDAIGYLGDNFAGDGLEIYCSKLAQNVALYGSELLPLIEQGLEKGTLDEEDTYTREVPQKEEGIHVVTFIRNDGRIVDSKKELREMYNLAVYRQLERIQRKLGLGLDLEENKGPAKI